MPNSGSVPARPLAQFSRVDTRDPAEAEDAVGKIFCEHRLSPTMAGAPGFHAVHNSAKQDGFSINYVAYGAEVDIDPGRLDRFFLLQMPLSGGSIVETGAARVESGADISTLLSPTLPTRMRWAEGTGKIILKIDREVVERHFSALVGASLNRIEFDPALRMTAPEGEAIRAQLQLLCALAEKEAALQTRFSLAQRQLRDALIGQLLTLQPHSEAHWLERIVGLPAPAHVKRAEDFIRAHAGAQISPTALAEAAGVSLRALQEGFKRFRGRTLGDAIFEARLSAWNKLLQDPARSQGAVELAFEAGIGHPGRAAAAYQRRFGESPSETRRWARRSAPKQP